MPSFIYYIIFVYLYHSFCLFVCCCSLVTKSCPTLYDPMACSMPGFPVLHCLLEFAQIQVHWVSDTIQPSQSLLPSSPPALNLSQLQGLFQWVISLHQVTKVLEHQLQHRSSYYSGWFSGFISFRKSKLSWICKMNWNVNLFHLLEKLGKFLY